jgi:hypothetical protein
VAIHSQQGKQPTPRAAIILPEDVDPRAAGPPAEASAASEASEPPQVPETAERSEATAQAEPTPRRKSRVSAIWGLLTLSLLPGLVASITPGFWRALPSWGHWAAYGFSGALILVALGLIVTHDDGRGAD